MLLYGGEQIGPGQVEVGVGGHQAGNERSVRIVSRVTATARIARIINEVFATNDRTGDMRKARSEARVNDRHHDASSGPAGTVETLKVQARIVDEVGVGSGKGNRR